MINDEIYSTYNTDKKKIIFVLSYIKEGTAVPWKQNFWATTKLDDRVTPWTWNRFKDTLKVLFVPSNKPGEALTRLVTKRQGTSVTNQLLINFSNLI